jgi:hypothetical protein
MIAMRALLSAVFVCAAAATAFGQSYSIEGTAGYLQEWEIKASLTKTVTSAGVSFDGPVKLRHVGLCSVNGVEEKSGVVQLKVSRRNTAVEGTLAMQDDSCRIVAAASQSYTGLLNCRDAQGVPISFSINQTGDTVAVTEK